jgi:uncharacterized protein GlcG (DUF336 family)
MLSGGVLSITETGTPSNQAFEISLANGGNSIKVISKGVTIDTFVNSAVSNIIISLGAGKDYVRIDNDVTQTASITGTGSDTFYGGGGTTTLDGGSGPNRLVAGAGSTTLDGGTTGVNQLLGEIGGNVFNVTGGKTLVYNNLATDTINGTPAKVVANIPPTKAVQNLTTSDVSTLLDRAAAATPSDDGIVAIVDRTGNILGIRVEGNVSSEITSDPEKLVFAIDGAVAEARTAALFSNNQAPLTSRTIQDLSESTITQQEVESDPNLEDPTNPLEGPGFVAPVEIGAHFPANIPFTPQVDLFDIQSGNRDSDIFTINGIRDPNLGGEIVDLMNRFNIGSTVGGVTTELNGTNVVAANSATDTGSNFAAPESYGYNAFADDDENHYDQARGIGTLPGGVPLFKNGQLVGGIGVFFPGTTGYATAENSSLSATYNPKLPDRSLEAEFIAFFAAGGSSAGGANFENAIGNAPAAPAGFDLPNGRIDLAGITLDIYGPGGVQGIGNTVAEGERLGIGKGDPNSNATNVLNPANDGDPNQILFANTTITLQNGIQPAAGWIANPVNGLVNGGQQLTASDVTTIVNQALAQASVTQAAIRTPAGTPAQFVIAISDLDGNIIGLYRESDATVFSESVAVAKARNVSYYADPAQLQSIDEVPGIPAGTAFTSRTFRYLADPRYPEGIDGAPPGPFSILNDGEVDPHTGLGGRKAPSQYTSVQGHNDFFPDSNFHQGGIAQTSGNQNGIVFFPGGVPLYKNGVLVGGVGISGDGVNQDDLVTALAAMGYDPPATLRVDNYSYQGVRLPYQKFGRNPEGN